VTFSFFDHTGDIGVRLEGRTPDALFRAGAAAFAQSTTDPSRVRPCERRSLALEAAALDLLLVDFLSELLYLFDARQFVPCDADVHVEGASAAWRLQATVRGEPFDGARHPIKVLIKAVTYHALTVREDADGWHATVVFDI
jgi:SHS2 domain-containing protein